MNWNTYRQIRRIIQSFDHPLLPRAKRRAFRKSCNNLPAVRILRILLGSSEAQYRREQEALANPAAFAYLPDPQTGKYRLFRKPRAIQQRCGAKCRNGCACRMRVVPGKRRCRLHGGLSRGPKTAEGKARIAESNRRRAVGKGKRA